MSNCWRRYPTLTPGAEGVSYELAAFDSARENAKVCDVSVIEFGDSRYSDVPVRYADISV
jgi:hypothetical protein